MTQIVILTRGEMKGILQTLVETINIKGTIDPFDIEVILDLVYGDIDIEGDPK
jgi:hypothetical protein